MNRNEFIKTAQLMNIRKMPFEWKRLDCVRHHNRKESGESWKHYLAKCILSKILYDMNRPHFTEYELPNKTVVDVYEIIYNTAIEFESVHSDKKEALKIIKAKPFVRDIIVIDLGKIPDDIKGMELEIRKRIHL